MIALGGTLGTGLFVGAGGALQTAGPLGALLGFSAVGLLVYATMHYIGEMAAVLPLRGAFAELAGAFVEPALGTALGWNYWLQWAVSLPAELLAFGWVLTFWTGTTVPSALLSLGALGLLVALNLLWGVRGFGDSEWWLSLLKIGAVVAFIAVGLGLDLGFFGNSPIGLENWTIPGAPLKNGLQGFLDVFILAFFAFGGTELVGITAAETKDPSTSIPTAIKQTFWRITLFYIGSVAVMGLVLRNDDPRLLNPSNKAPSSTLAATSPFTLVFAQAGIPYADHLMNAVVASAILSAANSALYAASRTLMGLALQKQAPKALSNTLQNGVPGLSLTVSVLFGCIAAASSLFGNGIVFSALLKTTGVSGILTWMSIAVTHLRFRSAYMLQKRTLDGLTLVAPWSPYSNYLCLLVGSGILLGQGILPWLEEPENRNYMSLWTSYGVPFIFFIF
jgi:lysine-specific permease